MGSFTVRIRKRALGDIDRIRSWYRNIDSSLEDRFVRALNEALDRVQEFPFIYQVAYRNTHKISLKKFPYAVFYLIQESRIIVLAVIHHKRNPALAQGAAE
ncbi:MAG: type II toxin-antitoxin system RelE/ParE family toxin [Terracidiphilus sp.]